jgi:predicted small secreted protein
MKRHSAAIVVVLLSALALASCGGTSDNGQDVGPGDTSSGSLPPNPGAGPPTVTGFHALFTPAGGLLPYPYDAFFAGTTDGTLNVPLSAFSTATFREPGVATTAPAQPVQNALDGFSTTQPITARFSGAIDAASLSPANVIVLQVNIDPATKGVVGFVRPLVPGTDFSLGVDATLGATTLEITPLRPLAPKSGYLVFLLNTIRGASGEAASADTDFATIRQTILTEFAARPPGSPPAAATCATVTNTTLRALCQLTSSHFIIASVAQIPAANVILSFSFSTQSVSDTLDFLNTTTAAGAYTLVNTGLTTAQVLPGSPGAARIYAGTLRVPYYLTPPSAGDPTAPLTRYWTAAATQPFTVPGIDPNSQLVTRFKPAPAVKATLDIPLLLTIPALGAPGPDGWPIVIFQHGTPRTRGDALLVADRLSARGFAVIAIDLPLHGITPTDDFAPLRQAGRERTFDLDFVNNTTSAPGPDGVIDATGTHFINLTNLLVSRDNVRQTVADLITLVRTIPTIDYDTSGTADFDPARIHYIGYSFGGIAGTPFLGVNSEVGASALPMAAGGLTAVLQGSGVYGPRINAALAAANPLITPGSALYRAFFRDAQTAIDSADAINYAQRVVTLPAGNARNIHMFYIVGGAPNPAGGTWAPDDTVPFARSQALADLMGLKVVTASEVLTEPADTGVQVRLNSGVHGSYLDPRASQAVRDEMQIQITEWLFDQGTEVTVTDPTVIAP